MSELTTSGPLLDDPKVQDGGIGPPDAPAAPGEEGFGVAGADVVVVVVVVGRIWPVAVIAIRENNRPENPSRTASAADATDESCKVLALPMADPRRFRFPLASHSTSKNPIAPVSAPPTGDRMITAQLEVCLLSSAATA